MKTFRKKYENELAVLAFVAILVAFCSLFSSDFFNEKMGFGQEQSTRVGELKQVSDDIVDWFVVQPNLFVVPFSSH